MAYFDAKLNPFIKAFIISDALLYSSLNLVNILFAVYVVAVVPNGTVQSATIALAAGFMARAVVELRTGKQSSKLSESNKLLLIIGGMAAISFSYVGFAVTQNIYTLVVLCVMNGIGWGIAYPAKLALVARHINHDQASQEWGATDALNMTFIVITMLVGTYIVSNFNYSLLFTLAASINTIGIIPYVLYKQKMHAPAPKPAMERIKKS